MKRIWIYLLIVSLGLNIYFLVIKMARTARDNEVEKLYSYKKITHEVGFTYFLKQMRSSYPETVIPEKYFIVYMWDSTEYDFLNKDQMKVLDSMATYFGKHKLEYVFATEMEELASKQFLKRNYGAYAHVKMLFGMDDFISGLYGIKDIKVRKPVFIDRRPANKRKEKHPLEKVNFKQKPFYLIMDSKGNVIYTNEGKYLILKDTAFLNRLNMLTSGTKSKILN